MASPPLLLGWETGKNCMHLGWKGYIWTLEEGPSSFWVYSSIAVALLTALCLALGVRLRRRQAAAAVLTPAALRRAKRRRLTLAGNPGIVSKL